MHVWNVVMWNVKWWKPDRKLPHSIMIYHLTQLHSFYEVLLLFSTIFFYIVYKAGHADGNMNIGTWNLCKYQPDKCCGMTCATSVLLTTYHHLSHIRLTYGWTLSLVLKGSREWWWMVNGAMLEYNEFQRFMNCWILCCPAIKNSLIVLLWQSSLIKRYLSLIFELKL